MLTIVASLVSQLVTNPSVIRETWVRSELGRSPEEGKGYALQYAGLENSMECTVHGVANSRTRLSNFHFHTIVSKRVMPRSLHSIFLYSSINL